MTAKECYDKMPLRHSRITVRNINDPSSWYTIWEDRAVVQDFFDSDEYNVLNLDDLEVMGNVFEIIPDIVDRYENAKDRIFNMFTNNDYHSGKEIKELFTDAVKLAQKLYGNVRPDHMDFYNTYVVSEYPLSDNKLYRIKKQHIGIDKREIKAYKKQ